MMYALNLNEENRILSVTFDQYAPPSQPRVDALPDGDVSEYRYEGGQYIYDPLPKPPEPTDEPTADEILDALLGVKS